MSAGEEVATGGPGRPSPMKVVLFGSYDVRRHPRVAVLRDGIAAHGHDVTEVNRPLGMSTADKVRAAGSPFGALQLLSKVLAAWVGLYRAGRRRPAPDLVVVGYLGHFDVHLARLLWPNTRIALDHLVGLADTARDRGVATGIKYRMLDLVDRAALRAADTVIVDTDEQLAQLPGAARERAVVVPVGATTDWFEQKEPPPPPPLGVCFVGLYTPLHGAPFIGRAISMLAGDDRFHFTMVGSGQDLEATKAAAGDAAVDWLEWVPSEELPALVASQHVCLGIFGTTDKARRVVPTKVYQGLAAGNVVVTSDTEPQRRALGDAAHYVPPGDARALADMLIELAEGWDAFDRPTGACSTAARFSPARVVEPLLDRMEKMPHRSMIDGPALSPSAWLRFDLLREDLEALPPSKVLEMGPGRGAIGARIVGAGHDYAGVELSESSRAATAELLGGIEGGRSRLFGSTDDVSGERFEVICAFEVIEHIEDDLAALRHWVGLLEPGGRVFMSVPAWPERFSAADEAVGHFRRYTPEDFRALAEAAGLVDVEVRGYGFPLGDCLDWGRGRIAARAGRRRDPSQELTVEERTKQSGAWLQPPRSTNTLIRVATWPFRRVQRRFPDRGAGLVLLARAPDQS